MHQEKSSKLHQLNIPKPKDRINHHITFSASNRNEYIYDLKETGEESFNYLASISEAVIIPHNKIPTQGKPTSSKVPPKEPTQDPIYFPSNTLSEKQYMQQSITPTTFLSPKPSIL